MAGEGRRGARSIRETAAGLQSAIVFKASRPPALGTEGEIVLEDGRRSGFKREV